MPRRIKPHEKHQEQYVTDEDGDRMPWEVEVLGQQARELARIAYGITSPVRFKELCYVSVLQDGEVLHAINLMQAGENPEAWFRYQVLERDGWKCADCGSSAALQVHHITTRNECRKSGQLSLLTDPRNGVTLCWTCHEAVTGREREHSERFHKHVAGLVA